MVSSQFDHHTIHNAGKRINLCTSKQTGLSCVQVELEVPTVSGYFTLATECFNDSGSPHTLEHLIFLGSEQYPYKGVLDSLANRAFAQGTNAWTDTDHTAYTIETVGQEGFLRLLPIFVDHILYPTMTASGCYTEVYHINGKGEDAGVVYSEMQGVENTGPNLMSLRAQRALHGLESGYRSETGGILSEVRKLTVAEIRAYHAKYYQANNLVLVITGKVDQAALLGTLQGVDATILGHGPVNLTGPRPWVDSHPVFQLKQTSKETVAFPEEDESMGEIAITWPGPSVVDYIDHYAIDMLGMYLAHSAVSPMQAALVELEDPLCTDVDFYLSDRLRSTLTVSLASVPVEDLDKAEAVFFETIEQVLSKDLDMERMAHLIRKDKLKVTNVVETDPHGAFSTPIITDFIYGTRDGASLSKALDDVQILDELSTWSSGDWQAFMRKWLVEAPHLTIFGRPSAALATKLQQAEKDRIAAQAAKFGDQGLKSLAEKLKQAQEENDRPMPEEMIASFPVPPISSINFITQETARGGILELPKLDNASQRLVDEDDTSLPFFVQFDNTHPSEFVSINLYLTCSSVSSELRPYLSIFLQTFFLNPLIKDGVEIDYEDVVTKLEADTLSYSASFGSGSGFGEMIRIKLKLEVSSYALGITWLQDLIYNADYQAERIGVALSKVQNDLPSYKREGDSVSLAVLGALQLDATKSVARAANLLDQTLFLDKLEDELEEDEEAVLSKFDQIRSQLFQPANMRVHVAADVARLQGPLSSWQAFGPGPASRGQKRPRTDSQGQSDGTAKLQKITLSQHCLTPYGQRPNGQAQVISISTDSAFVQLFARSLNIFNDPDLPALLVLIAYLNAMEGLLWKHIRGAGLAYGADLKLDPESGCVYFSLYRAADPIKALQTAATMLRALVPGNTSRSDGLSVLMIDGAKSSLVFDFVSRESSASAAAHQSFINQVLKGQSASYRRDLLKAIQKVEMQEMEAMLKKHLVPLFEPSSSNLVCVVGSSKVQECESGFSEMGYATKACSLEQFEQQYIKGDKL
ncbi:Metalloenzyme, LuxS/M16 peptidase-like protein [Protomyces lactucae-debilis]|uniref:Metalloenzyme, LuxS/M16 peptidase-like protein n=1 Tax=Protomyces lactucae-debilis TaxID=2754530 RepID=A0A1Y2FU64_PROLT|nr:Metalloenzyme, LuxS/M16 peptidase-like protein [Protomyces lactucae-debilis]ORY87561.1 Metalloenzyme, LuxS/M16 peptidase-like protein [Protomyces lactucae-debilis]